MRCILVFLMLSILYLSPESGSGHVQITNTKVLERGDHWQCPSVEETERARNEIHQIAHSAITTYTQPTTTASTTTYTQPITTESTTTVTGTYTCNGTPGWRRVAFINMTDTSYNCPTGLRLTSYSKRTSGRSHTGEGCSSTTFDIGGLAYSRH